MHQEKHPRWRKALLTLLLVLSTVCFMSIATQEMGGETLVEADVGLMVEKRIRMRSLWVSQVITTKVPRKDFT